MKNRIIIPLITLLLLSSSLSAAKVDKVFKSNFRHSNSLDHVKVEIKNDVLILTCEYDHDLYVEITPDYELYISGKRIDLDRYQRRRVRDYYDHFMEIKERAKEIGLEGAKIGVEGAKIGLLAAKGAMKMLVSDYDQDDFEREIEEKAEQLEGRSEELEELADELEEIADEFEECHGAMKSEIDELDELDWF
jgi:hypothetical protein